MAISLKIASLDVKSRMHLLLTEGVVDLSAYWIQINHFRRLLQSWVQKFLSLPEFLLESLEEMWLQMN